MYREGSMVQKGQPLYRINSDDYKASATGSQAAVGQAKAQVGTAKAAYNSALANLASQEALAEQARVDVQRLEPLVGMQAVSKQAFDQAVTQYKTAQAAVANAKAAVNQAQANIASQRQGWLPHKPNLTPAPPVSIVPSLLHRFLAKLIVSIAGRLLGECRTSHATGDDFQTQSDLCGY